MEVRVDSFRLDDLSVFLHRRKSHIEAAMRKAARSTINMMRSYVVDELHGRFKVPFREFSKFRMRMRVSRVGLGVSLWMGSKPLLIQYLRPSVSKGGVRAGGKLYPRAFMPWKRRGDVTVFERTGKERLPLRRPAEDIDELVLGVIERKWGDMASYFWGLTRRFLQESEK